MSYMEQNIIGSIFLWPEETAHVYDKLSPECFADPDCREIYRTIFRMHKSGGVIDKTTVLAQLTTPEQRAITAQCADQVPCLEHFGHYVHTVFDD